MTPTVFSMQCSLVFLPLILMPLGLKHLHQLPMTNFRKLKCHFLSEGLYILSTLYYNIGT